MNNEEITFFDDNNTFINNQNNTIQHIELVEDPILPKQNQVQNDDTLTVPDWDLVPPFDSLDRGGMQ